MWLKTGSQVTEAWSEPRVIGAALEERLSKGSEPQRWESQAGETTCAKGPALVQASPASLQPHPKAAPSPLPRPGPCLETISLLPFQPRIQWLQLLSLTPGSQKQAS